MESPDDLVPPPSPATPTAPEPATAGLRFVSMIADDGREPPPSTTDADALGAWSAASVPWHPALLALAADLPRFEDAALPTDPEAGEVRLVAAGQIHHIPAEFRAQADAAGVPIVEATGDRIATVRAILDRVGPLEGAASLDPADALAGDFLALGAANWWIRDLTIAMGHVDTLSRSSLLREARAGATAWASGDRVGAENHLRAGFELLAEARERFYPLDAYILDFVLLDPSTPADGMAGVLGAGRAFTLVASGAAVDRFAASRPDLADQLRAAINEGWGDVAGGTWGEADDPFLPWSSLAWQYARGSVAYRAHLDDRNIETLARRRYGFYPQFPQVARRFGIRYAWLVALDAGRFPLVPESKRQWAAPDGTTLEAITRPPVAADRAIEGARIAWKMAKSMRDDGAATLPLARWPEPVAPWFDDFRRSSRFAAVLGRWVTANDYFRLSDRPFEEVTHAPDDLATPYLAQAAARRDPSPIAERAAHARRRAALDSLLAAEALTASLLGKNDEAIDPGLEARIEGETGAVDPLVSAEIERQLAARAVVLARSIVGATASDQPGYVVFNFLGVPRRLRVDFAGGAPVANAGKALRAVQATPTGTIGVVEVAPYGFAWLAEAEPGAAPAAPFGSVSVRNQTMMHETIVVAIDPATGGVRGINGIGEESARLGQQIVIHGLVGPDGQPAPSRMRAASVQVDEGGPARARITSQGTLHDPKDDRVLARFTQTVELVSGRPTLEIAIRLDEVDPAWLATAAAGDPWTHYIACRWAWPDAQSTLRRTALFAAFPTEADRPETAEALDITSRQRRTTLLFGGLAYHRRHGGRMLDTLLVAGSELAREFRVGVTLNLEHAFPSALDFVTPGVVARVPTGPPPSGPVGWLVQVDNKAVALLRLVFAPATNEGRGWGIIADLIETAGKPARCRLKAFRDPAHARQVNGHGDHIVDLPCDGDGAAVDLTPHEIARVELTFGPLPGAVGEDS